ncbi:MAG: hypothetical protein H6748_07560 [Spirochaetaceae bacterium]|nr:hypothetical protein [Myxococcales bacterium]MCB9723884.1 hypothetical protein [Spirochaetaceae bacterium]
MSAAPRSSTANPRPEGAPDGPDAMEGELAAAFGLTEREAVCAGLLMRGANAGDVADELGIAVSTAEKHLCAVRRKLGVGTSLEAAVVLLQHAAIGSGAPGRPPIAPAEGPPCSFGATTLSRALGHALDALCEDGVRALMLLFLPLGVASLASGDGRLGVAVHDGRTERLESLGPALLRVLAARCLAEPERVQVVDLEPRSSGLRPGEASVGSSADAGLCAWLAKGGHRRGVGVVLRRGPSLGVAVALHGEEPEQRFREALAARGDRLRDASGGALDAAIAAGALARDLRLTSRERDMLTRLAMGRTLREAASDRGVSERALQQLLGSARRKLAAPTTACAVAKAMALNALVFD